MAPNQLPAVATEEVRFAVVLNGGVSLAVWMGGAMHELNRLTWASPDDGEYGAILDLVRCTARADVIAGTSAGGINGAALALGQVNKNADLSSLRDLWFQQGRMESLLRTPLRGQPSSLLMGDDYFLPQLRRAMDGLAAGYVDPGPARRPVDLTLMTTLLTGAQDVTVDSLGQRIPDIQHDGHFRFRSEQFARSNIDETVRALALAARCSAGFPIAFEPSFVPVGQPEPASDHRFRPDMATFASWAKDAEAAADNRSRFAVDGGLLANTPTRQALDAIGTMSADRPLRRIMLLVHPHAETVRPEEPSKQDSPPTLLKTITGLLSALSSQGSRNFVAEIEEHNRNAEDRLSGRSLVLGSVEDSADLCMAAARMYNLYRHMRKLSAANDLLDVAPLPRTWSAERIRGAALTAQEQWETVGALPYLPSGFTAPELGEGRWRWGIIVALGIADAATDVLRRALGVAGPTTETLGTQLDRVCAARTVIVHARHRIRATLAPPSTGAQPPDARYWHERIKQYQNEMDGQTGDTISNAVEEILRALVKTAKPLAALKADEQRWYAAGLDGWDKLLLNSKESELTDQELRPRLIALEILTSLVTDQTHPGTAQPVELVQLSLQAVNPFTTITESGDDKLAGLSLNRFAGFLKRSWRVNDWIWGRLDAATVLIQTMLSPKRIRRVAMLGSLSAHELVGVLANSLYPGCATDEDLHELRARATDEVAELLADPEPKADVPRSLPALAKYCTWALHVRIITEELPMLEAAISADGVEGADSRSNGQMFLKEHAGLLRDLAAHAARSPRQGSSSPLPLGIGRRALDAFDRAGIGRETLADEATSDQVIRTAATATAVAATVLDSANSGLTVLKPATRALRGAVLLPYWLITGITRGGVAARSLALAALAFGGVLLTFSLLGALPTWAAGWGALLGAGAALFAVGYAALRSGTLLHGILLLAPVAPILAVAVERLFGTEAPPPPTTSPSGTSAAPPATEVLGVSALVAGLAVVLVLVVLASLPVPVRSPSDTLKALRLKFSKGNGWWRVTAAFSFVAALSVVAATLWFERSDAATVWNAISGWPVLAIFVFLLVFGGVTATKAGNWLRRYVRQPDASEKCWRWDAKNTIDHPAGAAAGWSVVYGAGYAAICWAAATVGDAPLRPWRIGLALGTGALAVGLLAVCPWYIPARARRRLTRALAADRALTTALATWNGQGPDPLVNELERRGATYRYLTGIDSRDPTRLRRTTAGQDLAETLAADQARPRTRVPVSIHLIAGAIGTSVGAATGSGLPLEPQVPTRILVAVAVTALLYIAGMALLEGSRLTPSNSFDKPGLRYAAFGGLGVPALAWAIAVLVRDSSWPGAELWAVLIGALVAAASVGLGLLIVLRARPRPSSLSDEDLAQTTAKPAGLAPAKELRRLRRRRIRHPDRL